MAEICKDQSSIPAESNKIKHELSDCAVMNNLLKVIKILDDEKLKLAEDVEALYQQLEIKDDKLDQAEELHLEDFDKGNLHSRIENLTQILSQCINFRDKIFHTDQTQLNFKDKFKILELIQAAHELKYQRIMREVLLAK